MSSSQSHGGLPGDDTGSAALAVWLGVGETVAGELVEAAGEAEDGPELGEALVGVAVAVAVTVVVAVTVGEATGELGAGVDAGGDGVRVGEALGGALELGGRGVELRVAETVGKAGEGDPIVLDAEGGAAVGNATDGDSSERVGAANPEPLPSDEHPDNAPTSTSTVIDLAPCMMTPRCRIRRGSQRRKCRTAPPAALRRRRKWRGGTCSGTATCDVSTAIGPVEPCWGGFGR